MITVALSSDHHVRRDDSQNEPDTYSYGGPSPENETYRHASTVETKTLAASKVIFFHALNLNCSIALDFSPIKNVNR